MATIRKRRRKDGAISYLVRVRLRGVTETGTFDRREDALDFASQVEADIRRGVYFAPGPAKTLEEAVESYYDSRAWRKLAGNDQRSRRRQLGWWVERLGPETPLDQIEPADIEDGLAALERGETPSGRPVGAATRNRYRSALSKVFSESLRRGWITDHPVRRVPRDREPPGRVRYLSRPEDSSPMSPAELPRFLAELKAATDPRLRPACLIMLSTGARVGELFVRPEGTHAEPARWEDVQLECVDADGDVGVRIDLRDTKGRRRKTLWVWGEAAAAVRAYAQGCPAGARYLMEDRHGRALWPRQQFEEVLRGAGISNFRAHDLRHTAASYLAMEGRTPNEIAEILGLTLQMVQRYAHLSPHHAARATKSTTSRLIDAFS